MEENEVFNATVDMYTGLLFEQKDLLFRIIEASYKRGYDAAIQSQIQVDDSRLRPKK